MINFLSADDDGCHILLTFAADQHRPDRRAEALAQAQRHAVCRAAELRGRRVHGHGSVHQPSAIHMEDEAVLTAQRADLAQAADRDGLSTSFDFTSRIYVASVSFGMKP